MDSDSDELTLDSPESQWEKFATEIAGDARDSISKGVEKARALLAQGYSHNQVVGKVARAVCRTAIDVADQLGDPRPNLADLGGIGMLAAKAVVMLAEVELLFDTLGNSES